MVCCVCIVSYSVSCQLLVDEVSGGWLTNCSSHFPTTQDIANSLFLVLLLLSIQLWKSDRSRMTINGTCALPIIRVTGLYKSRTFSLPNLWSPQQDILWQVCVLPILQFFRVILILCTSSPQMDAMFISSSAHRETPKLLLTQNANRLYWVHVDVIMWRIFRKRCLQYVWPL